MCKVNLNQELNGIELSFESKPDKATLDSIKAQGFRWNGRKMVWYAKQTADRLTFAESLGQIETATIKPATINLDNLGADPYENGELAQAIRAAFKSRGVKGCTVRCGWSGYTKDVTVTIKASEQDFTSIEEFKLRYTYNEFVFDMANHGRYIGGGVDGLEYGWLYSDKFEQLTEAEKEKVYNLYCLYEIAHRHDFNTYHRERKNYPQYTTAFCEKLNAVFEIANQWNYNHSDSMTDYFDVGYYLDINIKAGEIEPRATMTEEERTAYEEEQRQEEEERAREAAEWERQREEERAAAEERAKADKIAEEKIYNNIIIEDLEESEQIYITNMSGDGGKACNLEEVKEDTHIYNIDCVIDRKVIFSDSDAFKEYTNRFMYDYIFLYGKGGTASEDVRLSEDISIYNLTTEQRETVKFYNCHCVGVYLNKELQFVVDPQGYNYSRYVYLLTDESEQKNAAEVLKEQEQDSELKENFYFPAKVEEQAAQLHEGQQITIYQCNGWLLNSITAGSGTVTGFYMGTWAQYSGLYIELMNGRKTKTVFIRDGRDCLIYEGIKDKLPEEITRRQISNNMYEMFNADVLIPNTYNYYKSLGELPIIDTCYR